MDSRVREDQKIRKGSEFWERGSKICMDTEKEGMVATQEPATPLLYIMRDAGVNSSIPFVNEGKKAINEGVEGNKTAWKVSWRHNDPHP